MSNDINQSSYSVWPTWKSNRLFTLLLTILFAYAIVWLGSLIHLNLQKMKRAGVADAPPATIVIEGTGKVTGTPNIAQASLGLETRGRDVPTAQKENSEKMNAFIAELKGQGIVAEDIQTTNYTVYPNYRYDPQTGENPVDGYVVSQQVTVKIRDLTKIGVSLAAAGEAGLNQVSGLSFTIDEPEDLRAEAREEALAEAREKALRVAEALGVRLGRVTGFVESSAGLPPYGSYPMAFDRAEGGGVPDIQTGSLDVNMHISVTYEIE